MSVVGLYADSTAKVCVLVCVEWKPTENVQSKSGWIVRLSRQAAFG